MEILKAVVFGIAEGVTEWIPVSSTGHMIILNEFMPLGFPADFVSVFMVVIQLGAVIAAAVMFWKKLWPFSFRASRGSSMVIKRDCISLWGKMLIACIPAAIIGVLFDREFERLFYHAVPVAVALIILGAAFIIVEKRKSHIGEAIGMERQITVPYALVIGGFQVLAAVFPGTSRSGATILGALILGVSRPAAAEFTFCMAVPVMAGASLLKLVQYGFNFSKAELVVLMAGMLSALVVSAAVIKFFMRFIKKHDFQCFGWYRIAIGAAIIIMASAGIIQV